MVKAFWQTIQDNDYTPPAGHDVEALAAQLVDHLASPDPQLRNDLAYDILQEWIVRQRRFTSDQLATLRAQALTNLREDIGERGTDSVFLRSYSLWVLAFTLQVDGTLSTAALGGLLDDITAYVRDENDIRGWVEGKGWVHTTAHIASLLTAVARHPQADGALHERILMLIAEHITRPVDIVYGHGEDDRLVQTVYAVLQRNLLDISVLAVWLRRLEAIMEEASAGMPFDVRVLNAFTNTRNLVRSLYFPMELCIAEKPPLWADFRPALLASIKAIGLC